MASRQNLLRICAGFEVLNKCLVWSCGQLKVWKYVIVLMLVNIALRWDIEERLLVSLPILVNNDQLWVSKDASLWAYWYWWILTRVGISKDASFRANWDWWLLLRVCISKDGSLRAYWYRWILPWDIKGRELANLPNTYSRLDIKRRELTDVSACC